jgi:primosomal protein N' (replication factor Y)
LAVSGAPCVVIGARSALFLPFASLNSIILDEEHDVSYKQNEQGTYHARDMAVLRGKVEKIPVVLASATPSLETYQNVRTGKFMRVLLPSRFREVPVPPIELIDMRKEEQGRHPEFLSAMLLKALEETLQKKEQSLLFVNQRGYAPLSLCRSCGFHWTCPFCSVHLIEHKALKQLLCHHCGHTTEIPTLCPQCQSENSRIVLGIGLERALEGVQKTFPKSRCLALSSDTLSSQKRWRQAMESIDNNEVDILLGTQILAKGHHFPNLTLVGVLEADRQTMGGDLRVNERTFQLLFQVSGRAGREHKPGRVFLQTYRPESPLMQALSLHDREAFYEYECEERLLHKMPPFSLLIALIVSGRNEAAVQKEAQRLAQTFPAVNAILLGPAPAPLAKLKNVYRYRLLIKGAKGTSLQQSLSTWARSQNPAVSVLVDVDPYDFL